MRDDAPFDPICYIGCGATTGLGAALFAAKVERGSELKEGERVVRRERYAGSVSRAFTLAAEIDDEKASAQYKDGVLTLTLPKRAAGASKRLEIN